MTITASQSYMSAGVAKYTGGVKANIPAPIQSSAEHLPQKSFLKEELMVKRCIYLEKYPDALFIKYIYSDSNLYCLNVLKSRHRRMNGATRNL